MTTVKISSKNQMVLPKEAREHLTVGPGDKLLVVPKGEAVLIVAKPRDIIKSLAGGARGVYGKSGRYLKRERSSWKRKHS